MTIDKRKLFNKIKFYFGLTTLINPVMSNYNDKQDCFFSVKENRKNLRKAVAIVIPFPQSLI